MGYEAYKLEPRIRVPREILSRCKFDPAEDATKMSDPLRRRRTQRTICNTRSIAAWLVFKSPRTLALPGKASCEPHLAEATGTMLTRKSMHWRRANSQYSDDQKYDSPKSDLAKDVSKKKASNKVLASDILRLNFSSELWLQD